jgi:hypothetical protein
VALVQPAHADEVFNTAPMDFVASVTAQVPEPTTTVLWIAGGVALLALANRVRRLK